MYLFVRKSLTACALEICAFWIESSLLGDGEPVVGGGDLARDLRQLGVGQIGLQCPLVLAPLVAAQGRRHAAGFAEDAGQAARDAGPRPPRCPTLSPPSETVMLGVPNGAGDAGIHGRQADAQSPAVISKMTAAPLCDERGRLERERACLPRIHERDRWNRSHSGSAPPPADSAAR